VVVVFSPFFALNFFSVWQAQMTYQTNGQANEKRSHQKSEISFQLRDIQVGWLKLVVVGRNERRDPPR
jgi:hypothetical protein